MAFDTMGTHFIDLLEELKGQLARMSALVQQSVEQSIEAVLNLDAKLMQQVIDGDERIDEEEVKVEKGAINLLALYQPAASDLRLITTIINKFSSGLGGSTFKDEGVDIFVLVDESHRTQSGRYGGYGDFAKKMRRILPRACYLGFTGTPLLKRDKNTLSTFGGT